MKLIPSPEIKRVLKAVKDAGLPFGPVDIYPDRVTIHPPKSNGEPASAFDQWKQDNDRSAHR